MQPKTVRCPFVQSLSKVSTLKTMHHSKSLIVTLVPTKVTGHFFCLVFISCLWFSKKKKPANNNLAILKSHILKLQY